MPTWWSSRRCSPRVSAWLRPSRPEPELGPTHAWLLEQARRLGAVVTGSLIVQLADGSHRNRLLWARPDGEMLHYDKRHLFRMAGEHEHYSPGERQELFELRAGGCAR